MAEGSSRKPLTVEQVLGRVLLDNVASRDAALSEVLRSAAAGWDAQLRAGRDVANRANTLARSVAGIVAADQARAYRDLVVGVGRQVEWLQELQAGVRSAIRLAAHAAATGMAELQRQMDEHERELDAELRSYGWCLMNMLTYDQNLEVVRSSFPLRRRRRRSRCSVVSACACCRAL